MAGLPPRAARPGFRAVAAGLVAIVVVAGVWGRARRAREAPPPEAAVRAPSFDPAATFRERCLPCHRLGGEGGSFGPNLDRVAPALTPALVRDWILAPDALDPETRMVPARGLSRADAESLAEWVVATAKGRTWP